MRDFARRKSHGAYYRHSMCRPCNRSYQSEWQKKNPDKVKESYLRHEAKYFLRNLKNKYGITAEQYKNLLAKYAGKCAICGRTPSIRLCVDHNHKTGKVRGLLCKRCNTGFGMFEDSPELTSNAARYLADFH